jgi:hypothetical protein
MLVLSYVVAWDLLDNDRYTIYIFRIIKYQPVITCLRRLRFVSASSVDPTTDSPHH